MTLFLLRIESLLFVYNLKSFLENANKVFFNDTVVYKSETYIHIEITLKNKLGPRSANYDSLPDSQVQVTIF